MKTRIFGILNRINQKNGNQIGSKITSNISWFPILFPEHNQKLK